VLKNNQGGFYSPISHDVVMQNSYGPRPLVNEADKSDCVQERFYDHYGNLGTRNYAQGCFLGKGGFAQCYQLKDVNTGLVYAGKIISKTTINKKRAKKKLFNEIKIHRSMSHQNVVKFEHFFED
jgi:serine/threonine protein kinase